VREGEVLVVRGTVPAALLHSLTDVVKRARVERASIRAVKSDGHARLVVAGVDDGIAQRLRNTFGNHPVSRFAAAPVSRGPRNFGQLLGWAWLAWFLSRR
jgi:hypothetical protein